jgi:hypothetical protein
MAIQELCLLALMTTASILGLAMMLRTFDQGVEPDIDDLL